jgi:phospholipid/cholesterol/gamma-HCH transport system substrate-binding protein
VKVLNPLGTVYLAVVPHGGGSLREPIPTSRTAVSTSLLGDLGQVSKQVGELDMAQLKKALDVTSTNLSATSGHAVKRALTGLSEFSATLAAHSDDVEALVAKGSDIAKILAGRKGQLVNLIGQGQTLMAVLKERQGDISALLHGTTALSAEVSQILEVNRDKLNPMLRDLQKVSDVLARENDDIEATLPALARLSGHVAAATGNGPFLDVVVPNGLLPDALIQQCKAGSYPAPDKPIVGCRP